MGQQHPKNSGNKPLGFGDLARAALGIPDRYRTADSSLAMKIEPEQSMSNRFQIALSKRPLMSSLFQVAARADDLQPEPALKSSPAGHTSLAELMLNPQKLEAVLKAIAKKKKPAGR
jgi:hypothetical protein